MPILQLLALAANSADISIGLKSLREWVYNSITVFFELKYFKGTLGNLL